MRRTRIPGLLKEAFKGNYESPPAGEAAAALTTINLSTGTGTDPNDVLDAASSLGTTSTIIVDQNQGLWTGATVFRNLTSIGAIPSDSDILHLVLSVGTFPTENNNGDCTLEWFVYHANGASLTNNEGYHGGFVWTGDEDFKGLAIQRCGSRPTLRITQVGTPAVCHAFLFFEGTVLSNAWQFEKATDSDSREDYISDNAGDDFDDVFIGVAIEGRPHSPIAKPTFGNVTLKYEWVDR